MITINKATHGDTTTLSFSQGILAPLMRDETADKVEFINLLGSWLQVDDIFVHIYMPDALERINVRYSGEHHAGFRAALADIIFKQLPMVGNWGMEEEDYDLAIDSSDDNVRALLAMNGKYLEQLSTDRSPLVRTKVVERMIYEKGRIEQVDARWFDAMVNDEATSVLRKLVEYGKPEHLDTLIDNYSIMVRTSVATHGTNAHREQLLGDAEMVRCAIARKGYAIERLAVDESDIVRLYVAKYASADELAKTSIEKDSYHGVKLELAERGLYLDLLVDDSNPHISTLANINKRIGATA